MTEASRRLRCSLSSCLSWILILTAPIAAAQQEEKDPTDGLGPKLKPAESAVVGLDAKRRLPQEGLAHLPLGTMFPDFAFTGLGEEEVRRDHFKGRTLVLVYLSAEQRNSERAAIDAARILARHPKAPLDLLFVTADVGHREYFTKFLAETKLEVPLAYDTGHLLYKELGLMVFPSTLILDRDGRLKHVLLTRRSDYPHLLEAFVEHSLGLIDTEELETRIVEPAMTRSSPKTMAQRHREAARLLRDNELHEGAEKELRRALELDPESLPVRLDLADLYIHLARYAEADPILEMVLKEDPDHRGAVLLLGISLLEQGQLDAAEEALSEALVMNPDPERAHYWLGRLHEAREDFKQAVFHYRKAFEGAGLR